MSKASAASSIAALAFLISLCRRGCRRSPSCSAACRPASCRSDDQGQLQAQFTLRRRGATAERTSATMKTVEDYYLGPERKNVNHIFLVQEASTTQAAARTRVRASPRSRRSTSSKGQENSAQAIATRATEEAFDLSRRHHSRADAAGRARPRPKQRLYVRAAELNTGGPSRADNFRRAARQADGGGDGEIRC